ncbi:MAG: DUF4373 domain-containing protein [Bacteroidales bacterium]|nr:DUF4373 domain-containing protein [Bacteroidales bacterium]
MLLSTNPKITFFSHDVNMRNDLPMRMLRKRLGNEAYALWLMLLEICASQEDFGFNLEEDAENICFDLDTDRAHLNELIDFCLAQKLLVKEGDKICSTQLREHFSKIQELRQRRSLGGKKGMASRWHNASDKQPADNSPISEDNHIQPNNLTTEKLKNPTTEKPNNQQKQKRQSFDCHVTVKPYNQTCSSLTVVKAMPPSHPQKTIPRLQEMAHSQGIEAPEDMEASKEPDKGVMASPSNWMKVEKGNYARAPMVVGKAI